MKTLLPDSIMGRTLLVLAGALVIGLVVAVLFIGGRGRDALDSLGGRNAAERIAQVVTLLEGTPASERPLVLGRLGADRLRLGWGDSALVDGGFETDRSAALYRHLKDVLPGREIRVGIGMGRGPGTMMHGAGPGQALRVSVALADGSWLNAMAPHSAPEPLWHAGLIVPLALTLTLVVGVALWAARRAGAPLSTFAAAALRLGVEIDAPPMPETGPREVRRAAAAFNRMQERIRRFVQDRTRMLAAISHDLRTPITRLRLRAEFVEDEEQRRRMLADLDEMEAMIAATLAFARDDAAAEERRPTDVAALLSGLVEDMTAAGRDVRYQGPPSLVLLVRPAALKRALANLLDNAGKYAVRVEASIEADETMVAFVIDDDGPGIPETERERVFAPFVRLETSRSRETGGVGLGLSVARSAFRAHGGDIILAGRPGGGLRVRAELPRG